MPPIAAVFIKTLGLSKADAIKFVEYLKWRVMYGEDPDRIVSQLDLDDHYSIDLF
jgi:hypothetical protein